MNEKAKFLIFKKKTPKWLLYIEKYGEESDNLVVGIHKAKQRIDLVEM